LKHHLMSFLLLYNHQRKLKALKYQTPYDKMIQLYQAMDDEDKAMFFKSNPHHKNMGLNITWKTYTYPSICRWRTSIVWQNHEQNNFDYCSVKINLNLGFCFKSQ